MTLKKFMGNVSGAFAPTFAVMAIPLMVGIGIVVDYSTGEMQLKAVQEAADAAALYGAAEMNVYLAAPVKTPDLTNFKNQRELRTQEFAESNALKEMNFITSVNFDDINKTVNVLIEREYQTSILQIMGIDRILQKAEAKASFGETVPADKFLVGFVVDLSSTMNETVSDGSRTRIAATKRAVTEFFKTLSTFPDNLTSDNNIQTTAAGFSDILKSRISLRNGYLSTESLMASWVAYGGTASDLGMKYVANEIKTALTAEPDTKGYVIFLTDGLNNQGSSNSYTINYCNELKAKGVKIFGVSLMDTLPTVIKECANSGSSYIHNTLNSGTLIDFFGFAANEIGNEVSNDPVVRLLN